MKTCEYYSVNKETFQIETCNKPASYTHKYLYDEDLFKLYYCEEHKCASCVPIEFDTCKVMGEKINENQK